MTEDLRARVATALTRTCRLHGATGACQRCDDRIDAVMEALEPEVEGLRAELAQSKLSHIDSLVGRIDATRTDRVLLGRLYAAWWSARIGRAQARAERDDTRQRAAIVLGRLARIRSVLDEREGTDWFYTRPVREIQEILDRAQDDLPVRAFLPEPLSSSIERVLLDHYKELDGEAADASLAELAFVYQQLTGFDAVEEVRQDPAKLDTEVCRCSHYAFEHVDPDTCCAIVDGQPCPCDGFGQAPDQPEEAQ